MAIELRAEPASLVKSARTRAPCLVIEIFPERGLHGPAGSELQQSGVGPAALDRPGYGNPLSAVTGNANEVYDMTKATKIQVGTSGRGLKISVREAVKMHTATGSIYRVVRDAEGRWWFSGDNVPNPASRALDPELWWRIDPPRPWPPELGRGIELRAPACMDWNDPERVLGGGKLTSPVRAIRPLE